MKQLLLSILLPLLSNKVLKRLNQTRSFQSRLKNNQLPRFATVTSRQLPSVPLESTDLSLAISNQHQILVSGGADRTIKLWDLETGKKRSPKHILEGHAGQVWCVAVSPDGSTIASASADFTVKLWNIQTGKLLQTFTGHLGEVRTVKFNVNGKLVASGGDDLEIKLWKILT